MINPWMTTTPFMTLWLNEANPGAMRAGGPEVRQAQMEATRQAVVFWTDIWMTPITGPQPRRRAPPLQ